MSREASRRRRRLFNLWQRNPRCHWCHCPVVLFFRPPGMLTKPKVGLPVLPNEATIDHLNSRVNGPRVVGPPWPGGHGPILLSMQQPTRGSRSRDAGHRGKMETGNVRIRESCGAV